jgi:hypothetical protein
MVKFNTISSKAYIRGKHDALSGSITPPKAISMESSFDEKMYFRGYMRGALERQAKSAFSSSKAS